MIPTQKVINIIEVESEGESTLTKASTPTRLSYSQSNPQNIQRKMCSPCQSVAERRRSHKIGSL